MSTDFTGKRTYVTVAAPREVDIATSNSLRSDIERGISSNGWVIVDLTPVEFIDSTGLSALLACHHLAEQYGGRLVLVGPNERTQKLLHITQLDSLLQIYPSTEAIPEL